MKQINCGKLCKQKHEGEYYSDWGCIYPTFTKNIISFTTKCEAKTHIHFFLDDDDRLTRRVVGLRVVRALKRRNERSKCRR